MSLLKLGYEFEIGVDFHDERKLVHVNFISNGRIDLWHETQVGQRHLIADAIFATGLLEYTFDGMKTSTQVEINPLESTFSTKLLIDSLDDV